MPEQNIIKEESDLSMILRKLRKRDFSGNSGIAIKNSIYQFSTQFTQRAGSIILTIILARILMPELFGLYNLALATIIVFTTISEFGVGTTLITFLSKSLERKNKNLAKSFFNHLKKIKIVLVGLSVLILLASTHFIADIYYQKPIFLALIAGSLYIIFLGIVSFIQSTLQAFNNFKGIFYNEIVFEISRVILIPLAAILALKSAMSNENILFYIFVAFGLSYFIASIFIIYFPYRKTNMLAKSGQELDKRHKKEVNKFFIGASTLILSGIFFGYIDKIILGRYVAGEFIGYYSAAFNLVGALSAVIGFSSVLLPIFSRLKNDQLERGMKKTVRLIFLISAIAFLFTLLLSSYIILILYGSAYNPAVGMLMVYSMLILILPLTGVYSVYFMSREKPQVLTILLVASTAINIILNYFLVTYLLRFGDLIATYGAIIAVVISNLIYLLGMIVWRKRIK